MTDTTVLESSIETELTSPLGEVACSSRNTVAVGAIAYDIESYGRVNAKTTSSKQKSSAFGFMGVQSSKTFNVVRSVAINVSRHAAKAFSVRRPRQIRHLKEHLDIAKRHSAFDEKPFIPLSAITNLITEPSVDKELARSQLFSYSSRKLRLDSNDHEIGALLTGSDSQIVIRISKDTYRKIFAILTLIDRAPCIWRFVDNSICDSCLPLSSAQNSRSRKHFSFQDGEAYRLQKCFQNWSQRFISDFLRNQWIVNVLHFGGGLDKGRHHELHSCETLPFTKWNRPTQRGGFGQIYRGEIESSHHAFSKDVVAVKRLFNRYEDPTQNRETFKYESDILRSISKQEHANKHLIELLATFELSNKFYMVFPWADDDLKTFWQHRQPHTDLSTWLLGQFLGLSEALCLIHRYRTTCDTNIPYQGSPHSTPHSADRAFFEAVSSHCRYGDTTSHRRLPAGRTPSEPLNFHGRHGDIKPKNILYFAQSGKQTQQGILKITDFGIARFTPENVALKREDGIVPNSPTYRSPECDFENMEISSQCDMWALGCVYLVFLTWFFGGYGEVIEFAESRQSPDFVLAQCLIGYLFYGRSRSRDVSKGECEGKSDRGEHSLADL